MEGMLQKNARRITEELRNFRKVAEKEPGKFTRVVLARIDELIAGVDIGDKKITVFDIANLESNIIVAQQELDEFQRLLNPK